MLLHLDPGSQHVLVDIKRHIRISRPGAHLDQIRVEYCVHLESGHLEHVRTAHCLLHVPGLRAHGHQHVVGPRVHKLSREQLHESHAVEHRLHLGCAPKKLKVLEHAQRILPASPDALLQDEQRVVQPGLRAERGVHPLQQLGIRVHKIQRVQIHRLWPCCHLLPAARAAAPVLAAVLGSPLLWRARLCRQLDRPGMRSVGHNVPR
mmetsp:Transcript_14705/g.41943  ORF Transcript_14705/g.41943 Transcript_14705/m.41943 type:complete len:206 (-) Transcript_14705:371-988(-)